MKTTIEFSALQAFAKVVQTGSFTQAADALQTHKAHLSRVVSQLERTLGARLIERTTRSLSLTEVGREFHERSLAILAAVDDAQSAVQDAQAAPRGTLRLTCGAEFGMLAVSGWIHRYMQRYPAMKVDADITGRIVDLVHEGFDLAIRVGTLQDSSLTARRLGQITYALYASPAYLRQHGQPRSPDGLADHAQLVFATSQQRAAWTLHRRDEVCRVPLQPRYRASNSFAIRDAAIAGLGIALLPRLVGDPAVAGGGLRSVLPGWAPPDVPVNAVFASARFLAPKVRAFVELAAEALNTSAVPATA